MKKTIFSSLIILSTSLLLSGYYMNFIHMPVGFSRFCHLFFPPKDLYKPIVTDDFSLDEKGLTKRYFIKPKYSTIYEILFLVDQKSGIDQKYKFNGKIKAEFFYKDKLLFENLINNQYYSLFISKTNSYILIGILNFDIPLQNKYKDNISIKLTVMEADQELKKYHDSIKLCIKVSPTH